MLFGLFYDASKSVFPNFSPTLAIHPLWSQTVQSNPGGCGGVGREGCYLPGSGGSYIPSSLQVISFTFLSPQLAFEGHVFQITSYLLSSALDTLQALFHADDPKSGESPLFNPEQVLDGRKKFPLRVPRWEHRTKEYPLSLPEDNWFFCSVIHSFTDSYSHSNNYGVPIKCLKLINY